MLRNDDDGNRRGRRRLTTITNDTRNRSKERSRKHWHFTRAKLSRLYCDWLPVPTFRAQVAVRQSADQAVPPNSADSHITYPFLSSSAFFHRKYFQTNFSRSVRIVQNGSSNRTFSATLDDIGDFPRVLTRLRHEYWVNHRRRETILVIAII